MPIMSQRAYARRRGLVHSAVQRAVQSGRISTLANGQIESDVADAEWTQNSNVRIGRRHHSSDADVPSAVQYERARAIREHYQARLAKLEFEQKVGSLVPKDEVQIAAFNEFRIHRDAMLNLPDRLAAMLAAETEPARCHEILADEIRKSLNDGSMPTE